MIRAIDTRRRLSKLLTLGFFLVTFLLIGLGNASAAIIPVTTVQQKISGSGGCSLQEAIYSANLDDNVAIATWSGSTPVEVVTQCVPAASPTA